MRQCAAPSPFAWRPGIARGARALEARHPTASAPCRPLRHFAIQPALAILPATFTQGEN
jgi:hypothetical protein